MPQTYANAAGSSMSTSEGATSTAGDPLSVPDTLNDAALLRQRLKGLQVYLLAHEGKKDPNYSYPGIDSNNAIFVGPYIGATPLTSVGRMWTRNMMQSTFGNDWQNYRWKVYGITVNVRNLQN